MAGLVKSVKVFSATNRMDRQTLGERVTSGFARIPVSLF